MNKKTTKQLYKKLFYIYTAIILFIVTVLMLYFITSTKTRILETTLNYMKMMNEKSISYLEQSSDNVDNILSDLYQSDQLLEDLLHYLNYEDDEYWKYRLDSYIGSSSLNYRGYDSFIKQMMQTYPDIYRIELVSYHNMDITSYYQDDKTYTHNNIIERLEMINEGNLAAAGSFAFQKEIRDPNTLQIVGGMIVTFHTDEFTSIKNYYSRAEMIVYDSFGNMIFDTAGKFSVEDIENNLKAYIEKEVFKDYTVFSYLERVKADPIPPIILLTILSVGGAMILIGELCICFHLKSLTKRLNYILAGMNEVTTGDLNVRLVHAPAGDELDLISLNFNEMCIKLDRYIQKSYLAEIEQKNAELEVLQNQINPHFLYNTLEAIRMKAIINGDRDVGKMLYSMAFIFRSQLKESDVITVVQEIHYCKKYLELFEYRYNGKFKAVVDCPEELMNYPIIKFILQPVIENYFVHGIRGEMEGNEIRISVERKEGILVVHIVDNGRGMEDEAMVKKNMELRNNKADTKKTIGLMNVNRRIKAVYGMSFGVLLSHNESNGMHVTLTVGEEAENEKGNVS